MDFVDDQDRAETLKRWLQKYGSLLLIIFLGILLVVYGTQYWQAKKQKQHAEASLQYQVLLTLPMTNIDYPEKVDALVKHEPHGIYANLAQLLLAKYYTEKKQYPLAIQALDKVLQHSRNNFLYAIALSRKNRLEK